MGTASDRLAGKIQELVARIVEFKPVYDNLPTGEKKQLAADYPELAELTC